MAENKIKNKYLVIVDGIAPVRASFEVWAYSDEEAAETFQKQPHLAKLREPPQINVNLIKKDKLSVKDLLTGIVKLNKKL